MARVWRRLADDRVVMTVILVNLVTVILRGFAADKDGADHTLFWIEYACALYFALELAVKLRLSGWRTYWASRWNRFDSFLVLTSSPILLEPFVDIAEDVALLLLLRFARLARLVRLLNFIPNRDHLWQGITRALKAALGVALALATYCFLLSLAACHLFHDLAPEHFGDPLISVYSMFKVFTIEGWYEIPDTVAASAPTAWAVVIRLFFMGAVVTGGLLGLSLANAIFVDEMVMDNTQEVEHHIDELRREVVALREEVRAGQAQLLGLLADRPRDPPPP